MILTSDRIYYYYDFSRNIPQLLDNPVVQQIAAFHKKTEAQVLLKFLLQGLGVSIIPKSKNPVRIKENIEVTRMSKNKTIDYYDDYPYPY